MEYGILKAGRRRGYGNKEKIQRGEAGASACKSVHGEGHGKSDFVHAGVQGSLLAAECRADLPLKPEVTAERCVKLAKSVYEAYDERKSKIPNALRPVLVIGSEVPVPGGSRTQDDSITPTKKEDFLYTMKVYREAFTAAGMDFEDVIAVVVQPGVEFSDQLVHMYNPLMARALMTAKQSFPDIVFEGHSTDYQSKTALRQMVNDGVKILKVGPALTFALRQSLYLLEEVEKELLSSRLDLSEFRKTLMSVMDANPAYWSKYYTQNIGYQKSYSYSDRCRYYFSDKRVQGAINRLLHNLNGSIPEALISQYFPLQYRRIMRGALKNDVTEILLDSIVDWMREYDYAIGIDGF